MVITGELHLWRLLLDGRRFRGRDDRGVEAAVPLPAGLDALVQPAKLVGVSIHAEVGTMPCCYFRASTRGYQPPGREAAGRPRPRAQGEPGPDDLGLIVSRIPATSTD